MLKTNELLELLLKHPPETIVSFEALGSGTVTIGKLSLSEVFTTVEEELEANIFMFDPGVSTVKDVVEELDTCQDLDLGAYLSYASQIQYENVFEIQAVKLVEMEFKQHYIHLTKDPSLEKVLVIIYG